MTERELRRGLAAGELPGEREAADRAWRVIEAAHAGSPAPARAHRLTRRLAAAVALAVGALAAALTPAGADVREWIGDALDGGNQAARSTLPRLPGPGRLLVTTRAGAWIVPSDGPIRRLGRFSGADWSPRGLYVVVTGHRRITAMEPDGDLRWTFPRSRSVSDPAWSPGDGFRIAYLAERSLRVVAGNGQDDHGLAAAVAPVTPAWRPGRGYAVTFVDRHGRIATHDADSGRRIWARGVERAPVRLAWTADGRRLVALLPGSLLVLARDGRLLFERRLPRGTLGEALALRRSRRAAVVVSGRDASRVLSMAIDRPRSRSRSLFAARGRLTDLSWSPDGRWLLVAWRDADRWVLLRRDGKKRLAFSNVADQFDPGATGEASFPRVAGWCCP